MTFSSEPPDEGSAPDPITPPAPPASQPIDGARPIAPSDASPAEVPAEATVIAVPTGPRGYTLLAWLVILGMTSLIVIGIRLRPGPLKADPVVAAIDEEKKKEGVEEGSAVNDLMSVGAEIQGKFVMAASQLLPKTGGAAEKQQTAKMVDDLDRSMNQGPVAARLRFIVLASEIAGPRVGLEKLADLRDELANADHELTTEEAATAKALQELLQATADNPKIAPQVEPATAEQLSKNLGWFGRLALAPAGAADTPERKALINEAQQTMAIGMGGLIVGGLMGCLGFLILGTLITLAATGKLASRLTPSNVHPGIYAETFALWMVLFSGLNLALLVIGEFIKLPPEKLLIVLAVQFASLGMALAWPVVRGVRWGDVRRDLGIYWPQHFWLEPLRGIATYALSLPMLGVGVLLMLMLIAIQGLFAGAGDPFETPGLPSHPIVESVRSQNPWMFWQVLLVAAVGAPIVEEIMFRGALYRSLRDSTRVMRAAASVLLSMAISGFLFAVIHPQGWVAIPALGSLATGFAVAREWRGTIWPAIIAHGINNGMITCVLFSIL